jgi:glycosyltransferase involved in cell wall biosynthesis
MNFVLIGHGNEPIPPKGWGAVENVIWNYKLGLNEYGHTVHILNSKGLRLWYELLRLVIFQKIDVIHSHAEKPVRLLSYLSNFSKWILVSTTHNPLNPNMLSKSELKALRRCAPAPFHIVLKSETEDLIRQRNSDDEIFTLRNGVENVLFKNTIYGNGKACYIGRIQERKRQNFCALALANSGIGCDFIGPLREDVTISDELRNQMVGEWSREEIYSRLCEYSCLILLSESEGQPLVVVEALAAGIPVVVSPAASANLDLNLPFIHLVVSENEIVDKVRLAIAQRDKMTDH